MRIVYIHQHFTTQEGVSGTKSYDFARYLVRRGHRVVIITGNADFSGLKIQRFFTRLEVGGIEILAMNLRYSNYMSYGRRLVAFMAFAFLAPLVGLRVKDVDLVFATSTPLTVAIPGYLLSCVKRSPFVFEVRDLWPDAAIAMGALRQAWLIRMGYWLEKFAYRAADKIVVVSQGMKDWILEAYEIAAEKIAVIPGGADVVHFSPGARDPKLKRDLGLDGRFLVVYAGDHGMKNGLDAVIQAAAVAENDPRGRDIAFLFVGDGGQKPLLERLARDLGLGNVLFLGPRPKSEMPRILATSDVCLVTVKNHKVFTTILPNKFFDYAAAGRPIVVNFPGELQETLEASSAGIGVPPDDPHALANAIIFLKEHRESADRMGRNARELALGTFNRQVAAARLEAVFEETIKKRQ